MSWFGETFGDSLNSLKGQITKITKEVLSEDEATNSSKQEQEGQLVKELEALCESKDLEIASLRDESNKLVNHYKAQIEFLLNQNKANTNCDNVDLVIKKLETELSEVKQERDHYYSSLEELQSEHQVNLDQVINIRDKYKAELESLKEDYNSLKAKQDETDTKQSSQEKNSEVDTLNSKINELQLLLQKEKENSCIAVKKEVENQIELKKQTEKLLSDIQQLKEAQKKLEDDLKNIQKKNEHLESNLNIKEKENKENQLRVKLLSNEKEELLKQCQKQEIVESELSSLKTIAVEVEKKLKNLFPLLNLDVKEVKSDSNILDLVLLVENKVSQESNKNWKELSDGLELEVKKLKEENKNFQNKLKLSADNNSEIERKYQEEITLLKNSLSEMKTQEQDCINQSQTDDVKRLEQEIAQCMSLIHAKNNEITNYSNSISSLELELKNLKASILSLEKELSEVKEERSKLTEENVNLRNLISPIKQEKLELEEKIKTLESEKLNFNNIISQLQSRINELEKEMVQWQSSSERITLLEKELENVVVSKTETEKHLLDYQNENSNLKSELQNLKAQVIIKESNLAELMKTNAYFKEEMNKIQTQNSVLVNAEIELKKWKDASVDLQIQLEDLLAKKEELETEFLKLKSEFEMQSSAKDAEIQQLKLTNTNLMKSCNDLHHQLESKAQLEHTALIKENTSDEKCLQENELILQLQEENSELKSRVQKFQEQMKMLMFQQQSPPMAKDDLQQHRRSKSAVDTELFEVQKPGLNEDLQLKQALQEEQAKNQLLQQQFQEIFNKEINARKEFERLKQHLIEVEDHYTEEAVENEKIINDLKSKLVAAEEQLQNSSTLYTSLKVRDNQHLESLQSQIRMVSVQRDDLQGKLSAAEDEIQKHKASLMSLQIVLEQFQQDKERELEEVAMKYERQLQGKNDSFRSLESEIQSLKNQLSEAKNGLKAASRLGEQLEKKTQQVTELEENLNVINKKVAELEQCLAGANQANNGKIDKSLIKNLVVGYVLSPNAERKSQVLRIMASVLDFDQDERNKMGVDANRSGWLSNILHPKGEGPPSSQSLSEAFIKFLENESRPQPQLKLLPEQLEASPSTSSRTPPKPYGHVSELILPTFDSSQENESSIILKNVLKDS